MPKGLRRQCTICANPERGRLDYLLVCSAPYREIPVRLAKIRMAEILSAFPVA